MVPESRSYVEVPQPAEIVDRSPRAGNGLRVDVQPERGSVRVRLAGELDIATVDELEATLKELRERGFRRIVLDLRELDFMGSCGLRLLLVQTRRARQDGCELVVVDAPRSVRRVIEICGMREQLALSGAQGSTRPRRIA
jgi:anti-anti-sigma factor